MLVLWGNLSKQKILSLLSLPLRDVQTEVVQDYKDIAPLNPRAVLVLGSKPMATLEEMGLIHKKRTIGSLRGKAVTLPNGIPLLITYSPDIRDVDHALYIDALTDAGMAARLAKTGSLDATLGSYKYVEDFKNFIQQIEEIYEKTQVPVPVALDLETVGLDEFKLPEKNHPGAYIVSIQVSCVPGYSRVVHFSSAEEEQAFIRSFEGASQISFILSSPKISLRGANLKYDLRWLYRRGGFTCTNFKFDTTLVGSLLDENRVNGLDVHAKIYGLPLSGYSDLFDATHDKSRFDLIPKDELLAYASADTDATLQVAELMKQELLQDPALTGFYVNILHPAARAFERVERNGILINQEKMKILEADLNTEALKIVHRAKQIFGGRLVAKHQDPSRPGGMNITKASLLTEYLFGKSYLNLKPLDFTPKPDKDGNKKPSTSMDHILKFKDVPEAQELVNLLKDYGSLSKTLNTYVVGFLKHLRSDGRFHPSFFFFVGDREDDDSGGTVTGRLSCKNPAFQTIPVHTKWAKRIQECYEAPPGYLIGGRDYCLPGSTRVLTTRGVIPIKDINTGDKVLVDGEPLAVIKSGKTGSDREVFRVVAASGRYLKCTSNHKIFVVRDGEFQYIAAEELTTEDWLVSEDISVESGTPMDADLAYVGGLFMGDGCYYTSGGEDGYARKHIISFSCGLDSDVLVGELRKVFGNSVGTPSKKGDTHISSNIKCARFSLLFSKYLSRGANIPPCIWGSNLEGRLAFISGAFDSEGSAYSGRVTISSVSEGYVRGLAVLASTVGIFGVVRKTDRATNFSERCICWHFDVFSRESLSRFPNSRIPRKQKSLEGIRVKSYTQCRTEFIPFGLIVRGIKKGMQRTYEVNRLVSNGRRKGRATRDSLKLALLKSEALRVSGMGDLLKYRYDRVKGVEFNSTEDVYDITVEKNHCFNADGYRVHNSQGELRVISCIAGESNMLAAYRAGMDLHSITSGTIAGYSYEEMMEMKKKDYEKFVELRFLGKAANFGMIYLISVEGFRVYAELNYGVSLSLEKAEEYYNAFFNLYPQLTEYHNFQKRWAKKYKMVRSPLGRVRHLPLIDSPRRDIQAKMERISVNAPTQSTLSDMMLWSFAECEAQLEEAYSKDWVIPFGAVHDSGYDYLLEDRAEELIKKQVEIMQNLPFHKVGWQPQLQFVADAKVGPNLADLKELKF